MESGEKYLHLMRVENANVMISKWKKLPEGWGDYGKVTQLSASATSFDLTAQELRKLFDTFAKAGVLGADLPHPLIRSLFMDFLTVKTLNEERLNQAFLEYAAQRLGLPATGVGKEGVEQMAEFTDPKCVALLERKSRNSYLRIASESSRRDSIH